MDGAADGQDVIIIINAVCVVRERRERGEREERERTTKKVVAFGGNTSGWSNARKSEKLIRPALFVKADRVPFVRTHNCTRSRSSDQTSIAASATEIINGVKLIVSARAVKMRGGKKTSSQMHT